MIAALFVESGGAYFGLEGVDPWDVERDARLYPGPWPVVAHPPCQLWVNFAALNFKRYGGEHNRPGNDGGCFASALASVRKWGGVLEHPASSNAWASHGLPAPVGRGWQACDDGGWVAEVWQSAYGHRARKRTWLYAAPPQHSRLMCSAWCDGHICNRPPRHPGDHMEVEAHGGIRRRWPGWCPPPLDRRGQPGTAQVGWFDRIKPSLGKREASATPPAFRDLLLGIARSVAISREAA